MHVCVFLLCLVHHVRNFIAKDAASFLTRVDFELVGRVLLVNDPSPLSRVVLHLNGLTLLRRHVCAKQSPLGDVLDDGEHAHGCSVLSLVLVDVYKVCVLKICDLVEHETHVVGHAAFSKGEKDHAVVHDPVEADFEVHDPIKVCVGASDTTAVV